LIKQEELLLVVFLVPGYFSLNDMHQIEIVDRQDLITFQERKVGMGTNAYCATWIF
jgi:hypothetical protein